jgi:O-6-methylguanine DNA methyltransferase
METTLLGTFRVKSPIGELVGFLKGDDLCALGFGDEIERTRAELERRFGAVELKDVAGGDARRRLSAYVSGDLGALDDIRVDTGGTEFQQKVWSALRRIPAGQTASYSGLAVVVGAPTAVRAVGTANGANPVPVVIPCHRVVRSDGSLGGYGGGLDRKRWLLDHEKARLSGPRAHAAQRPLFTR